MNSRNTLSQQILSEWAAICRGGGNIADYEDYYLSGSTPEKYIAAVRTLNQASVDTSKHIFSSKFLTRQQFQQISRALGHAAKFNVTPFQWEAWGSVQGMNLNSVANFDVSMLDARHSSLANKSLINTTLPDYADLYNIDLSRCVAKGADFKNVYIHPKQLLTLCMADEITPPKDFNFGAYNKYEMLLVRHMVTSGRGWNLNSSHVKNTDISMFNNLNVGKLITRNREFIGVTFPEYEWKSQDKYFDSPQVDDMSGTGFINCDLSRISGVLPGEVDRAYWQNSKTPAGTYIREFAMER